MAVDTPAQPSTSGLATTTSESRGGFFTDTNGVGIDLSSVAGPAGMDGRGIATITASPANPILGEDVTITVTYTDGSTPTSFTVAAGTMGNPGADGASVIPIFFRLVSTNPTTGNPSDIREISENLLEADTHYAFVRTDDSIVFQDGTLSLNAFALQIENGRLGFAPLTAGQGEPGVSFVDIFFEPLFDPLGNLDSATRASINFDPTLTYRAFIRTDNPAYFTNNDYTTFNATAFEADVPNVVTGYPLEGPQGMRGLTGDTGPQGNPGMNGAPGEDGIDGISIVNLYIEEYQNLQGNTAYRNPSTVIADHHTHFSPVRTNDNLVFPNGYDLESNDEQFFPNLLEPQREADWGNLLRAGDIILHELGGLGPPGDPGDTGPQGNPGIDGNTVTVWYATSADGQNAITTYTDEQFIAFETHTAGTAPTAPTEFERFIGTDGMDGAEAPRIDTIAVHSEVIDSAGDNEVTLRITLNDTPASTYDVTFTAPEGPQGPMGQMGSGGSGTTISAGPGIQIIGTDASVDLASNSGLEFTTTDDTGQLRINVGDGLAITSGELHTTGSSTDTTYSLTVEDHANGAQLVLTDLLTSTRVAVHPIVGMDAVNVSNVNGTVRIQGHDTSYTYSVREQSPAGTGDIELVIAPDVGDPGTNQIISLEEGHGIDFELVDAQTFRISSTGEIPSGTELPLSAGTSGDTFIVIGNTNDALDGFYYSDGTSWIKDDTTYTGDGTTITLTGTEFSVTNPFTDADEAKLDALNGDRPIRDWVIGQTYTVGEQVLYNPPAGSQHNIPSIYIRVALTQEQIDAGITVDVNTPPESGGGTIPGWLLLRSGIVALSTNDGAGDAGITSNSTLRINHGAGVDVTRQQTLFTISTHSTSGSDVNDFRPGWAYSYFNLIDNTTHTGTVGERQTGFEIDAVELIGADTYLHIDFQDPNPFTAGDHFAFRTSAGNTRNELFPNNTDQDRIIYAIQDSNSELVIISAVDPPVSTLGQLSDLFGVTSGTRNISPISFQNLFTLDEHHSGQTGTAPWAQTCLLYTSPSPRDS